MEQARTAPEAPTPPEEEDQDVESNPLRGKGLEVNLVQAS